MAQLFRRKPIAEARAEVGLDPQAVVEPGLRRSLTAWQLTALGIGAIIGAGIFSGAGTAVAGGPHHLGAGPALVTSYILVALAGGFAALCYAETAWIIGWDLIIEYAVGNIAVAVSWSAYFQTLLRGFGMGFPEWLATDPRTALQAFSQLQADPTITAASIVDAARAWTTAPDILGLRVIFNLPAVLIVALITWVLVIGIRESARVNTVMVVIKLAILFFFVAVGAFWVRPENWTPFAPNGWAGITAGAALIFFAYIGFDAVST